MDGWPHATPTLLPLLNPLRESRFATPIDCVTDRNTMSFHYLAC
jgi:hypothetical protein